jgi:hypothetical protein
MFGKVGSAWATTCDQDDDGYQRKDSLYSCSPRAGEVDCNDIADQMGPTINPGVEETVGDGVDQNCDGSDGASRAVLLGMKSGMGWTTTGSVSFNGDAMSVGTSSYARIEGGWPQWSGGTYVVVDVDATNGGACSIEIDNQPWYGNTSATVVAAIPAEVGTALIDVGADPNLYPAPRKITRIAVRCGNSGSRGIDWVSVQDATRIFAPGNDIQVGWKDVETPGTNWVGPLSTRADRSGGELWGSSNVAGVARWDLTNGWQLRDGDGATGLWQIQDRKVWDVAPLLDGTVLILTGGYFDGRVHGGMLESYDQGESWERVLDSGTGDQGGYYDGTAGQTIAADGGLARCTSAGTPKLNTRDWTAGRLMVDVPDDPDQMGTNTLERVYIAGSVEGAEGVYERGTDGRYCTLPADWADTPPTYIGAMQWTRTNEDGKDWLLIGYKGDLDSMSELWACELPPGLECPDPPTAPATVRATCAPVDGLEGIDVHDIEVDPDVPGQAYIADYGRHMYTVETTEYSGDMCTTHDPEIFELDYDGTEWVSDLSAELPYLPDLLGVEGYDYLENADGENQPVVGLAVGGGYLFAFMHSGYGTRYGISHGIFRLDLLNLPWDYVANAYEWEDLTTDATEATREQRDGSISGGAWITYDGAFMKPEPHPADRTADIFDGIWLDDADGSETPGLIAAGGGGIWRVLGLDDPGLVSTNTPESATTWEFLSNANTADPHTWQLCGGPGLDISPDGNIWVDYEDAGPFELVRGDDVASHDCIFQANRSGGGYVSVAQDGTVWIADYDQRSEDPPQNISVYRSTDGGASWCFQGAEVYNSSFHADDNEIVCRYDQEKYRAASEALADTGDTGADPRTALACDADGNEDLNINEGISFWEGGIAPDDSVDDPSWGNPHDIVAVSAEMAIAAFGSYSDDGDGEDGANKHTGTLGYTVDGGKTWSKVPFDGGEDDCDAWQFFRRVNKLSPRLTGHHLSPTGDLPDKADATWFANESGWGIGLTISAGGNVADWSGDTSDRRGGCAVAYVTLDSSDPGSPTWTWARLPNAGTDTLMHANNCYLSGPQVWGVAMSPTAEKAYVYGQAKRDATVWTGGICSIPYPFDGSAAEGLLRPTDSKNRFDVYAVAPSPDVADVLFVQPSPNHYDCFPDGDGCDPPLPFVLERNYWYKALSPPPWVQQQVSATNLAAPEALASGWRYVEAEDTYMWAINITGSGGYYTDLTW